MEACSDARDQLAWGLLLAASGIEKYLSQIIIRITYIKMTPRACLKLMLLGIHCSLTFCGFNTGPQIVEI